MEQDLGAKLDWVAVDHVDTVHPCVHVIVHGHDQMVIDGVDGRVYHVTLSDPSTAEQALIGAIDEVARGTGVYRPTSTGRSPKAIMSASPAVTMTPLSAPTSGGLRRCAAPASSSGSDADRWLVPTDF